MGTKNLTELRPEDVQKVIPELLRTLRNEQGLSVQDVANRVGFKSRSSYFKYEAGERSISIDQLSKLVLAITGSPLMIGVRVK